MHMHMRMHSVPWWELHACRPHSRTEANAATARTHRQPYLRHGIELRLPVVRVVAVVPPTQSRATQSSRGPGRAHGPPLPLVGRLRAAQLAHGAVSLPGKPVLRPALGGATWCDCGAPEALWGQHVAASTAHAPRVLLQFLHAQAVEHCVGPSAPPSEPLRKTICGFAISRHSSFVEKGKNFPAFSNAPH
jgi:hypothetical protein